MPTAQKSFIGRIPPAWRVPIGFVLGVAGGLPDFATSSVAFYAERDKNLQ